MLFPHVPPMLRGLDGVRSGGIYDAAGAVKENCCEMRCEASQSEDRKLFLWRQILDLGGSG